MSLESFQLNNTANYYSLILAFQLNSVRLCVSKEINKHLNNIYPLPMSIRIILYGSLTITLLIPQARWTDGFIREIKKKINKQNYRRERKHTGRRM